MYRPLFLLLLCLSATGVAGAPLSIMRDAVLDSSGGQAVLLLQFDSEPTFNVTSSSEPRTVLLNFQSSSADHPVTRLAPVPKLIEVAEIAQASPQSVQLKLRAAPGTDVTVYRRQQKWSHTFYCIVQVVRDSYDSDWPVKGRLSSHYGMRMHPILHQVRMHQGIDIAVPRGTPIRAVESGRVAWADWKGGSGLCVIIEHANGMRSRYMHCAKLYVHNGDLVRKHQVVAEAGSTGLSTGPHLHFSVEANGQDIDPERYLTGKSALPRPRPSK